MILEPHRQGLSLTAIARRLSMDRKSVRRYISRGLEPPAYGRASATAAVHRSVPVLSARGWPAIPACPRSGCGGSCASAASLGADTAAGIDCQICPPDISFSS
jgi:hypothetical protein